MVRGMPQMVKYSQNVGGTNGESDVPNTSVNFRWAEDEEFTPLIN